MALKSKNTINAFFFDHVGAKKKALQKRKRHIGEFRRLRAATRTPRPRPRRLLEKAGENFYPIWGRKVVAMPTEKPPEKRLRRFLLFYGIPTGSSP